MKLTFISALLTLALSMNIGSISAQDKATLNLYRLEESMMSGGRGLNIELYVADKKVGSVQTNTKVMYKTAETGSVKVKCVATFSTGPVGKPWVENIEIEAGKEYHISVEAGSMFGVKGEVLDEKGLKKMSKAKFSDTVTIE